MIGFLEVTVGKFIFKVANDRLYSSEGIWAKQEQGQVQIGLSDFLQQRSGDVAFVEVAPVGSRLAVNEDVATIETIKVNIALSSPVAGTVVRINPKIEGAPEVINQDPYGAGWLCEIQPDDWESDSARLLSAGKYFEKMKREAEEETR